MKEVLKAAILAMAAIHLSGCERAEHSANPHQKNSEQENSGSLAVTKAIFEKAAGELEYLNALAKNRATGFLHIRLPNEHVGDAKVSPQDLLAWADEIPRADLLQIVHDADPKIRTLALYTLYLQCNPKDIPLFHEFIHDDAPSFRGKERLLGGWPAGTPRPPDKFFEQTVSTFANSFLDAYLRASDFRYGVDGDNEGKRGYKAYWEERKDLKHTVGWFEIRLKVTCLSRVPPLGIRFDKPHPKNLRRSKMEKLPALLEDIHSLGPERSAWTLLFLDIPNHQSVGSGDSDFTMVSEDELVAAARRIPRPSLLKLLYADEIESPDPDIANRQGSFEYEATRYFILEHASELLQPSDAADLLAHEQKLRGGYSEEQFTGYPMVSPSWAIAAADLQPSQASTILREALERFSLGNKSTHQNIRARLVQEISEHEGPAADAPVISWFYSDEPEVSAPASGRPQFAQWLGESKRAELVKAIIADPRAVNLDWFTLLYLGRSANQLANHKLITSHHINAMESKFQWKFQGIGVTPEKNIHRGSKSERQEIIDEWRKLIQNGLN